MIKLDNIICDGCRKTIKDKEYSVVIGKKRTLHYHKNGRCEHEYEMVKYSNRIRDISIRKRNMMSNLVGVLFNLYCIPFSIITVIVIFLMWIYIKALRLDNNSEKELRKNLSSFTNQVESRIIISTFVYLIIYLTR